MTHADPLNLQSSLMLSTAGSVQNIAHRMLEVSDILDVSDIRQRACDSMVDTEKLTICVMYIDTYAGAPESWHVCCRDMLQVGRQ